MSVRDLELLQAEIIACRRCARLVDWRDHVAADPPRRHRGEDYWARPVPSFGDPDAALLVVGLAPAAHGANRTGRMFTGDRSGDWLYRALHRAGFANQPTAVSAGDGLELCGARIVAPVHCAPPDNKPAPEERDNCASFFRRELALLDEVRVAVVLGAFAYQALWKGMRELGDELPRARPKFGHGVEVELERMTVIGSFHPSQQNTFTGRLTEDMFDAVFARARVILDE